MISVAWHRSSCRAVAPAARGAATSAEGTQRDAQQGTRVEAIGRPTRVGNQPGDRRAQGNPHLLNRWRRTGVR